MLLGVPPRGQAPGFVHAMGHGPDPWLRPWRGAPVSWSPTAAGVCSAAPSWWAPPRQPLHLRDQNVRVLGWTGPKGGHRCAPPPRAVPTSPRCRSSGVPCPHPAIPTFLPIQGGQRGGRGAAAWLRGGVLRAQGVKPLGCTGGQVPGQHPKDTEGAEETPGVPGPHAAASGCQGWGGLAHAVCPRRLLPWP